VSQSKGKLLQLRINGEIREFNDQLSLVDLVKDLNLPAERIAIELNREVVRRSEWEKTSLKNEDQIEIVHFVGGGTICELDLQTTIRRLRRL